MQCVIITLCSMKPFINNISVDCIIFGFDSGRLNVLLTKRELEDEKTGNIIFTDYTVQGHHVLEGEHIDDAARRVLKDKTGFDNIYLEQFHTFGDPGRIQHERDKLWISAKFPTVAAHVVSVGYCSLVDSTKVKPDTQHQFTSWWPVDKLPLLGYDHAEMIARALDFLRIKIQREPVGFELLPEKFTLSQLQNLYEAILGVSLDRRNFRKKVGQMKFIIPLNEKQKGVAHKPAQVFIFSRDVYDRTKKEKLDILV